MRAGRAKPISPPTLALQFEPEQILVFAERCEQSNPLAVAAGKRIREGDFSRRALESICSSARMRKQSMNVAKHNTDFQISVTLKQAVQAKSDRTAIQALCRLDGVGAQTASIILSAIDPDRWIRIDRHMIEAFGISTLNLTVSLYLDYLSACRGLAQSLGVSLQTVHRALTQCHAKGQSSKPLPIQPSLRFKRRL